MPERQILIIGGGFSGVSVACHLLQQLTPGSHLTLVDEGNTPVGSGLAYGTQSPQHLLNVPAARMAWCDARPDDFVGWLRSQNVDADGSTFVQRGLYGQYLAATLASHLKSRPDIQWHQLNGRVVDLGPDGAGAWRARLADGRDLRAAQVVLTVGNFMPACPHPDLGRLPANLYVADPWRADALDGLLPEAPVALIGTGLTMLDQLMSLRAAGHRGPLLALSRRGLLPQAHRQNELPPPTWHAPAEWLQGAGLRQAFRMLRTALANANAHGHDWRDIWVALRPRTAALWQALGERDRAQFLRHLQAMWDVHRHRAAPQSLAPLQEALAAGRLNVVAGRLVSAQACDGGVRLQWRARAGGQLTEFMAARVFNCTGPSTRLDDDRSELLAALRHKGRLQPCPLKLGLLVDAQYRLQDTAGRGQPGLYYAGPMLRAQHWEATAVPELRRHAEALALAVLEN